MDASTVVTMITGFLSLIEGIIPLLGSSANATTIDNIINSLSKIVPTLTQLIPLATNEVKLIIQGIKNIIANLQGDSVTTSAAQDAALDALDAQVDAAWDAVEAQFDPDYVPPTSGNAA